MKLVKILSAFAVFAAAGMMAAGCNSPAGNGYDLAASAETGALSYGVGALSAAGSLKTIKVRFNVRNGGWGLVRSYGIASWQADNYLVAGRTGVVDGGNLFDFDFEIDIIVPASETYLNIRWKAVDLWGRDTYLKAKTGIAGAGNYKIVLDYNGQGKVATENLYDVSVSAKDTGSDFSNALERAGSGGSTAPYEGLRIINVKFEVKDGGGGLKGNYGIVSTRDDSCLLYDYNADAQDFSIRIIAPASDEYLNIRWKAVETILEKSTFVRAKMKAESGTITLDYNGKGKVATKNLTDVSVTTNSKDWDDAESRVRGTWTKPVKVKFNVKNGGWGLLSSEGIVSTETCINTVYNRGQCANDYTITIEVPPGDKHLNILWCCNELGFKNGFTYVQAKMKAESGTITLDYNGNGKIAAKNLTGVSVASRTSAGSDDYKRAEENWERAKNRAVSESAHSDFPY